MPIALPQRLRHAITNIPLRWVLVIPFALQTLTAVSLVGYLSYRSGQQSIDNLANQLIGQTSARIHDRLNTYLQVPQQLIELNRRSIEQGKLDIHNPTQLEQRLLQQILPFPELIGLGWGDLQGGALGVSRDQPGTFTTPGSLVLYETISSSRTRRIYHIDQQATRLELLNTTRNFDPRQRPWYYVAVQSGKPSWTPIFPWMGISIAGLNFSVPVYRNGTLQGVMTSGFVLSDINRFLGELHFSPSGQSFILERSGNLVATSTQEQPFIKNIDGKELIRLPAFKSTNSLTRTTALELLKRWQNLSQIQDQVDFKFESNGKKQFVHATPYGDSYGLDWLVVTVIPESNFTAEIEANNAQTTLLCWLTLFATMALGALTARWITEPILRLNQASHALAQGKWQQPLSEKMPIAELKTLTRSFNQTATQLQRSLERTKLALYESEDKFAKIFRASPDAITIVSVDNGSYVEVNDRFLELTGYSREEIIGRTIPELELLLESEQELEIHQTLETQRRIQNYEMELRTKVGDIKTGLLSSELIEIEGQSYVLSVFKDYTERKQIEDQRKQTEEALHFNIELFRQIVENTRDALYVYSFESQEYIYRNSVYRTIWGWNPEILNDPIKRFQSVHPSDRLTLENAFEQEGQGYATDIEYRIILPDGRLRWLHNRTYPIHNLQGQLTRLAGILEDITDRKQVEEQLRESEERLRVALDAARMGNWDWNILTNQIAWSENLQRMTGMAPGTFDGNFETVVAMLYPDDRNRVLEATRRAVEQGDEYDIEFRFVKPDGSIRWALGKGNVLRDSEGRAVRMVGVDVDITARKLAEAKREKAEVALRESEERFRLAFEDAAIGMAIVALDGRFMGVNRSLCEMMGYSEAELLQRTVQDITHPQDLNADWKNLQQLVEGEHRSFQMEKRYIHKQGQIIWSILSASIIRDPTETPLYFVSQIQDISDRHSADRVKDEFISVVSHELRTPLTGIRGSLGLLKSGKFDHQPEKFGHILQMALSNSDRLIQLINDILDLERLESGTVQLVKDACDVPELLRQAAEAVQTLATQASLSIHLRAAAVMVEANFGAIVQTLTNLLSNAIKFSPANSIIWLSADVVYEWGRKIDKSSFIYPLCHPSTPCPYLLFSVTDQGRGIPPEKLEAIFGRFQQVDASDSRQKGGTGLGLAICKSIVQQHDGQIWVESGLGVGSTFYFTLPLSASEA